MRDLKAHSDIYATVVQLGYGLLEDRHAIHEDRLIALKVPGKQQSWRIRV